MALFETLTETYENLDNWLLTGLNGAMPTAEGEAIVFHIEEGVPHDRSLSTSDAYTLTNSWFSFRAKSVGSYAQKVIGKAGTQQTPLLLLNNYPGFPGLSINRGATLVTLPADSQPIIMYSADDTTLTISYSTDEGNTWTTFETMDLLESTDGGDARLEFETYSLGTATDDYTIEFDQINQYNFDGPVSPPGPELTEVDVEVESTWNVEPFVLRWSSRHVHQSVCDYVTERLEDLGWTVPGSVPTGSAPVRIITELPDEWDPEESMLENGTLAITLGDEPDAKPEEMGGSLASIDFPIFVDIYYNVPSEALSLALDVRDIFCGRLPGAKRYLDVTNYASESNTLAPGYRMEFENVQRSKPSGKVGWQVVKCTAVLYFPETVY